jgi:hypothetical protein
LNDGLGSITLDTPTTYLPGEALDFTVEVERSSAVRFGFEVTIKDDRYEHVGTFVLNEGANTQFASGHPAYVTHDQASTTPGKASWAIRWLPPSTLTGTVTIYAAGNAANGLGSTGDFIYTVSQNVTDANVAPIEVQEQVHGFDLEPAYPNPFVTHARLKYTLYEPAVVTMRLYDLAGRIVQTSGLGYKTRGLHVLEVEAGSLGNGFYVCEVQTPSWRQSQPLMLIR